jgi:head-tail adaptor
VELCKENVTKLCEIGVIYGQLLQQNKVKTFNDSDEAYEHFKSIYDDWANFKDIRSQEEEGYISAFANRVLVERYPLQTV